MCVLFHHFMPTCWCFGIELRNPSRPPNSDGCIHVVHEMSMICSSKRCLCKWLFAAVKHKFGWIFFSVWVFSSIAVSMLKAGLDWWVSLTLLKQHLSNKHLQPDTCSSKAIPSRHLSETLWWNPSQNMHTVRKHMDHLHFYPLYLRLVCCVLCFFVVLAHVHPCLCFFVQYFPVLL